MCIGNSVCVDKTWDEASDLGNTVVRLIRSTGRDEGALGSVPHSVVKWNTSVRIGAVDADPLRDEFLDSRDIASLTRTEDAGALELPFVGHGLLLEARRETRRGGVRFVGCNRRSHRVPRECIETLPSSEVASSPSVD